MSGKFVHIPTRLHINDQKGFSDRFVVGDQHSVVIKDFGDDGNVVGVLEKKMSRPAKRLKDDLGSPKAAKRLRKDSDLSSVDLKDDEKPDTSLSESIKEENDPGWEEDFDPWSEVKQETAEHDDEDEGPEAKKRRKTHISKKEKKMLDKIEAEEIARAERRALTGQEEEVEPETPDEFDRWDND